MLKAHIDSQEENLLSQWKISQSSGHMGNRGTAREHFVAEFLDSHLPQNLSTGTGEVIDANSRPGQSRNQIDVVVYRNSFPKLNINKNINYFLVESVVATIEIKSTLNKKELTKAILAARHIKSLDNHKYYTVERKGKPSGVLCFVVAYKGPKFIGRVHDWINEIYEEYGITKQELPRNRTEREKIRSETIDGVFVLRSGCVLFDTSPFSFEDQDKIFGISPRWLLVNSNSLLILFLWLSIGNVGADNVFVDLTMYGQTIKFIGSQLGA